MISIGLFIDLQPIVRSFEIIPIISTPQIWVFQMSTTPIHGCSMMFLALRNVPVIGLFAQDIGVIEAPDGIPFTSW